MKRTLSKRIASLLAISLLTCGVYAQDFSKLEGWGMIAFDKESEQALVPVDVPEEFNYLKFTVEVQLQTGNLLCEILDPEGRVIRKINVTTAVESGKNTQYNSMVKGVLQKSVRTPDQGRWKVRLTPEKAAGHVNVRHVLAFHPKADVLELSQIEEDLK